MIAGNYQEIYMTALHQSPVASSWQVLDAQPRQVPLGGVLRLQARRSGWLAVQRGRVWLTRDGDADDHVLARGERIWLGAGEGLVVEPWQADAGAHLAWLHTVADEGLVAQAAGLRREGFAADAWRGAAAVLRGAAGRLLAAARSAEARASRAHGRISAGDSMASCGALQ